MTFEPLTPERRRELTRRHLLEAAAIVFARDGFHGATVDKVASHAGFTKGAVYSNFKSKDDLAIAAADHWSEMTSELFAAAPYHTYPDPLDRVLGYIDFRKTILTGTVGEFTCLVGTMVQETYDSHPAIRDACARSIRGHAEKIEADIAAAIKARGIKAGWTARSLALHTQAVLQGAFILAKATGGPEVAVESIDHLRRYIELLFERT